MSCARTRDWLHRESSTLDEAQRLVLDDHLSSCGECRGDRERLRLMRDVGATLPVPPAGAREYGRAIARALLEGKQRAPERQRRWIWLAPLAIGALAAVVIAIVITRDDATDVHASSPPPAPIPPAPEPPQQAPAPSDVVEDGVLFSANGAIRSGDAIPKDAVLDAREPARVRLAMARVEVGADSKLRWSGDAVLLDHGKVVVEAASQPVRVITEKFEIELVDARVAIETGEVRVERGNARVSDRSRKLLAELTEGGRWKPIEPKRPSPPKSARELVTRARAHLAAGEHVDAERVAQTALSRSPSRVDEAEARMFLAELAQASGNLALATTRYEAVAAKFADLPSGESALYAAARLEARRGRDDAAAALFDRYLARYPNGRYADDVRKQRKLR